jgi:hypothetical protein
VSPPFLLTLFTVRPRVGVTGGCQRFDRAIPAAAVVCSNHPVEHAGKSSGVRVGALFYGSDRFEVEFDDRVLAHLQIVMTAKLRRGEGFILSWTDGVSAGSGRSMLWIAPTSDLHYKFSGNRPPSINRKWLDELASLANTAPGLYVTEEGTVAPLT